jgi:predicted Zn-dependent protease
MKLLSIILVLIGYNNEVSVDHLSKDISRFYQEKIIIIKDSLPASAYNPVRKRYRADSIINYLHKRYPSKRVVALTSVDISATANNSRDWGVFGLASYEYKTSVLSTYRYYNKNLYDRTLKVMIHELGHTYQLQHCKSKYGCIMKAANHSVRTIDKEPRALCPDCNRKLDKFK